MPLFPKEDNKGSRNIKFSSRIWVERSDIKLKDQKGFYGIAPQKVVGLKYASTIFVKDVKEENGMITQVIAEIDKNVPFSLFRKPSPTLTLTGLQLMNLLTVRCETTVFYSPVNDLAMRMNI